MVTFDQLNKVVVILFLAVLFLDFGGVITLFKLEQTRIRKEIKRQIKRGVRNEDLFVFEFGPEDEKDLVWIKSHEFKYKGRLFDVVRSEPCGTGTVYWCINDIQEQILFAHLDELVKKKSDQDNEGKTAAGKLFKFLTLWFPSECVIISLPKFQKQNHNWYYVYGTNDSFLTLDSPPPRTVFFHI